MTIENYIIKNGPCLSSELIEHYSKEATKQTVRKRISRVGGPIFKLSGFFKDRQVFFYHKDEYQKDIYYENLRKAIKSSAKRYFSIIKAIEYHNGYIKKEHLASYTFVPINNLKTHINFKTIIEKLKELKIVFEENDCYILNPYLSIRSKNNYNYYKAIELSKNLVINQFNDFVKSIGLISYDSGKSYSEYSKFQFCFTAPSYVNGITINSTKLKPAFVLADVLLGNGINEEVVDFFLRKIDIVKSQSKCNFLPFLIVDNVSQEAFEKLKKKGIIVGFINKLFGNEYEELLKSLVSTITNAGTILKKNPEAYLDLIQQFDKLIDGKTNNLKGDLFELAVGYYYSNLCQSLDIGKIVTFEDQKREIDVLAMFQEKIIVSECKAYKTEIELGVIETWITEKIPVIYKSLVFNNNEKEIIFEFWSTSGFSQEAKDFLETKKNSVKKYQIEYYSKKEIMEKARKSKAKKINEIMRDYFIKGV